MEIPGFIKQGSPAPYPSLSSSDRPLALLRREANPTAPLIFCSLCSSVQGVTRRDVPVCRQLAAPPAGQQRPLMHYFTPWFNIT